MLERYLNTTRRGTLTCKDADGNLYDPQTVQISFKKGDGSEDVLTYGGNQPTDTQLTRVSKGKYAWWYTFDKLGVWSILERWKETVGGATVCVEARAPELISVVVDEHGWTDASAPSP